MSAPSDSESRLHVFYDSDSEEYWVASDLANLRDVIDAEQGAGSFVENYGGDLDAWDQCDDGATKSILFTGSPDLGPASMASEDDNPADCQTVTKTWSEWAAWHGRGYFGGGRS